MLYVLVFRDILKTSFKLVNNLSIQILMVFKTSNHGKHSSCRDCRQKQKPTLSEERWR